jgi:CO/xanthine dehydrogenase Mo-binding subunit
MDELAVELAMDPIELRIRNEPEKDPLTRLPFSQCGIVQAWRDGAARFGWDKRSATPAATREGDWLTGMGCATGTYPYYGIVKANEYSRFLALNPAERGGNSRAKTVGLQPAMVREQAA